MLRITPKSMSDPVSETIVQTGPKLALTGTIRAPGQSLAGWRRKPVIVREIRGLGSGILSLIVRN